MRTSELPLTGQHLGLRQAMQQVWSTTSHNTIPLRTNLLYSVNAGEPAQNDKSNKGAGGLYCLAIQATVKLSPGR